MGTLCHCLRELCLARHVQQSRLSACFEAMIAVIEGNGENENVSCVCIRGWMSKPYKKFDLGFVHHLQRESKPIIPLALHPFFPFI